MTKLNLENIKNVLILGATGGIGAAIMQHLLKENSGLEIYTLTRHPIDLARVHNKTTETINEASLSEWISSLGQIKFDLIVNAIGYLENHLGGPEKSLREMNEEKLLDYFRINAVLTPLLAKAVRGNLSSTGYAFVTLSAMVGSIGENDLGGWYGYRASKTALNAFIRNISIEWGRTNKLSLVLAIHPGTTQTKLSEKFNSKVTHKVHTPSEAAQNICEVIFSTPFEKTGSFLNWDQRVIAW